MQMLLNNEKMIGYPKYLSLYEWSYLSSLLRFAKQQQTIITPVPVPSGVIRLVFLQLIFSVCAV